MAGANGQIVRRPKTATYKPQVWRGALYTLTKDGKPWLTWQDVEGMRRDPTVSLGLRILRAPIAQCKPFTVANDPQVAAMGDQILKRFWKNSLGHALTAFEYGNSAGEPVYKYRNGQQVFDRLNRIHINDVRLLEYAKGQNRGEFAGLRVTRARDSADTQDLAKPWCWWFALDTEPGSSIGRSRLHGPLEPWREKRGRHGAIDSRRLFFHKCAFTGGMFRYPDGSTNVGTEDEPLYRSNQSIAREILEKFENGGIICLPNTKDPQTGDFLWTVEFGKLLMDGSAGQLIEYPKELDKEIFRGLGIPPEIVEASTVGSGYSGRAIPAQVFFASLDEVVNQLLDAIKNQIASWVIKANFGRGKYFEFEFESMAEMVAKQPTSLQEILHDSINKPDQGQQEPTDPLEAMLQAAGGEQRMDPQQLGKRLGLNATDRTRKPHREMRVYPIRLSKRISDLAAKKYPKLEGWTRDANGNWVSPNKPAATPATEPASANPGS